MVDDVVSVASRDLPHGRGKTRKRMKKTKKDKKEERRFSTKRLVNTVPRGYPRLPPSVPVGVGPQRNQRLGADTW
jgi:hypothetical protein